MVQYKLSRHKIKPQQTRENANNRSNSHQHVRDAVFETRANTNDLALHYANQGSKSNPADNTVHFELQALIVWIETRVRIRVAFALECASAYECVVKGGRGRACISNGLGREHSLHSDLGPDLF